MKTSKNNSINFLIRAAFFLSFLDIHPDK